MKFINWLPNLLFQIEQLQVINFNMVPEFSQLFYCSFYPLYLYVYTNFIKQYDYCILLFSFHSNNNYSTYLFFQEST